MGLVILFSVFNWGNSTPKTPDVSTPTSNNEPAPSDPVEEPDDLPESEPAETEPPAPTEAPFESDLTSGHYTAGIDFPAGTYTITWISGSGNVSSDNMFSGGLNEIFSDRDLGITEYKNAKFPDGVVLSVSSVKVHISSDSADVGSLRDRENPLTEEISLTSGNYTAGEDFPGGIYDVIAVKGKGNVNSSNIFDGGINAIMSPTGSDLYESSYKNIELPDGVTLTVSGVEIKLVPSK